MSLLVATQIIAVATAVLAGFAIVTAGFAIAAFVKQREEVATLKQEAKDQNDLTAQQGKLLTVQAEQLDVQRQQLDDQRKINKKQAEVAGLQAEELRESLDQRMREAAERRRAQASRVFLTQEQDARGMDFGRPSEPPALVASIHNSSDQPIYGVEVLWRRGSASWGEPNPEPLPPVLPGVVAKATRQFPEDTNFDVSGAIVRFTDAAGVRWMRRPDGKLIEHDP